MKAPLSWLREFVDVDLAPEALAERLTLLGMEVRGIERRGTDWHNVVIGELLTVEKHPNADRLSLTTVTLGSGEPLSIVCGATNIAPGQRIPVALPGAILPGDRRIERTEKMGVVSNGMLCSGDELNLTADGDGILILGPETPLGASLADLYGDVIFDIDVKPNRGDALSILGLAREIAAITGGPVRMPSIDLVESYDAVTDHLSVEIADRALCPRFVGRWVSNVLVAPSPDAIQMRLLAAGVRPISNVVDASNYVMIELGKPIHTFDGAKVDRGHVVVRTAQAGERLITLDHIERALGLETLLIADAAGPLAIAGVMGGAASEVSTSTTEVIVESAIFDPVSIRRTAFQYALRSEASLRFEKGQEFRLARIGADRTAGLLATWAGGSVARGRIDTAPDEPIADRVRFRPARVGRILGVDLAPTEQIELLARVGIVVEAPTSGVDMRVDVPVAAGSQPLAVSVPIGETLEAIVPSWRRDISIEADVIEELARVNGYDRIPATLPATTTPRHRASPLSLRDFVRHSLAGLGLREVVTHALVSPEHIAAWSWAAPPEPADGEGRIDGGVVTVTNPLSADHAVLRQDLIGGLVAAVVLNRRRGRDDLALFEIGKGYGRVADASHEWWRLGIALTGAFDPTAWNRARRSVDLDDAKGVIEALSDALGFVKPAYAPLASERALHPGRSATFTAHDPEGRIGMSGVVGEIHPAAAEAWDERAAGSILVEVSIRGLSGGVPAVPRAISPSRFPSVERDLAIVVAGGETSGHVEATIRASAGTLLRSVEVFDLYEGPPLNAGERSLAYRLTFGAAGRTLADDEVEAAIGAVTAAIGAIGGRIRT